MRSKKFQWGILGLFGFWVGCFGIYRLLHSDFWNSGHSAGVAQAPQGGRAISSVDSFCKNPQYPTSVFEMKDGSMKGFIEAGQKYQVTLGWYRCNPVKRGDLVFYRYHSDYQPVPRLVQGISGDQFKLVHDRPRKAWDIAVNGQIVMNAGGKEPHYFGMAGIAPVLSLFEKSMKGVLAPTTYLIFTSVSPGDLDSEMGVVSSVDFMGRVEPLTDLPQGNTPGQNTAAQKLKP